MAAMIHRGIVFVGACVDWCIVAPSMKLIGPLHPVGELLLGPHHATMAP